MTALWLLLLFPSAAFPGDCLVLRDFDITRKLEGGQFEIRYQSGSIRGERCLNRDPRGVCVQYDEVHAYSPGVLQPGKASRLAPGRVRNLTVRKAGRRKIALADGFSKSVETFEQVDKCGRDVAEGRYDRYTWIADTFESKKCLDTAPGTAAKVIQQHACKVREDGSVLNLDCQHVGGIQTQFVYFTSEADCVDSRTEPEEP